MSDYGAGHGSPWHPESWHPDDPLQGEQGWDGGQQHTGGWDPLAVDGPQYHTGQYPQVQPEQHYSTQEFSTGQYPTQQFPQQTYPPQDYPQQPQAPQWDTGQQPAQGFQGETYGWNVQAPYADPGYGGQGYADPGYGDPGYGDPGYGDPGYGDPFGGQGYPADPYGGADLGPAAADPYAGGPGYHPQDGYPQQQFLQQTQQIPVQQAPERPAPPAQRRPPAPEQTGEWNPFEDDTDEPETHPFFTRGADADEADEEHERRRPRGRGDRDDPDDLDGPGKARKNARGDTKRRSGCACLAVVLALGGMVSGGGYEGYQYYESHYAAPPDYSGQGSGSAQVQVPDSSTLAEIGNILKQDGVVKSVDAFTRAAAANPKGSSIQGGIYVLRRDMSAASAVMMMLDPAAQSSLTVPEGWRATQVYQALDTRLGLAAGTTAAVARSNSLGLPSYASGNPEGFLYPSRYSAAKGVEPADILRQMVQRAEAEYSQDDLQARAASIGRTPYQIIVIASLIQAEAQQPQDFGKVSRVIYNRLAQDMALGFDSTINYAKGRSTLHTTTADTQFASPYNTYLHKGLPPGPIDNPGHEAIEAALNPTPGDWLYFVTVQPGDTRFTASAAQHERNVEAFNKYQQEHGG